jgi:hypothetical protein
MATKAKPKAKKVTEKVEVEEAIKEEVDVKQIITDRIAELVKEMDRMPNRKMICVRIIDELSKIREVL